MQTSKTVEWSTPQDLFDQLNDEFKFGLDPCATKHNAKCNYYFTIDDDGLLQDWSNSHESAFVNPPYGRVIYDWMKKCYKEHQEGMTVVALVPARTDTKWFHEFVYNKAEIRFIKGRLKFGETNGSAPFPSIIVIWRNK